MNHTPDTDQTPKTKEEPKVNPVSPEQLLRQTGSGGFLSVGSICGKVGPGRPRRPLYRHSLHAGR